MFTSNQHAWFFDRPLRYELGEKYLQVANLQILFYLCRKYVIRIARLTKRKPNHYRVAFE